MVSITCGLIGSGKSTWANKMTKEDASEKKKVVIINRDALRTMLRGEYVYDKDMEKLVRDIAEKSVESALANGFDVIIDETNLTREKRRYWFGVVGEYPDTKIRITYFPENKNNLKNRMNDPKGLSEETWADVLDSMKKAFEEPSVDELPDKGELVKVRMDANGVYTYEITPK